MSTDFENALYKFLNAPITEKYAYAEFTLAFEYAFASGWEAAERNMEN